MDTPPPSEEASDESSSDESYVEETEKSEICGKEDGGLLMCDACQDEYLEKIDHRNLVTCAYGHIYEACPNLEDHWGSETGFSSIYECREHSEYCPVCKHDIPYQEFLAHMETDIDYLTMLQQYMDLADAYECWYCWPCN